jgi:ADP-heptose:LPS heptosyltransferase
VGLSAPANLNPDRMRRIDRWLGVPICFALTTAARIFSMFSRPCSAPPPANILLIELAEMGSTVLAYPAIQRLRSSRPDCRLFFLLFRHIQDSVRVLKVIPEAHVMTIDVSNAWTIVRDTWRFMGDARRYRIDTAINLETFVRFSTILSFLSGARTRVGFHAFTQPGLYIGDLQTHKVNYNPHLHTWQSMMALVQALDAPSTELPLGKFPAATSAECVIPRLTSDSVSTQRILGMLPSQWRKGASTRLIAINPNASKLIGIRKWPLERYADLVGRLLEDARNVCVITGLASEREDARYILDRVKSDRLIDLTGKTSLKELIDLFNLADVLVTNDSGPAHFAALTSTHVVVFFGPETPHLYKPLTGRCTVLYSGYACSPCVSAFNQRRSVCTNNRCLQAISVEEVYGVVRRILEGPTATQPSQGGGEDGGTNREEPNNQKSFERIPGSLSEQR